MVESELINSQGLRSLSPKNEAYKGIYEGNQEKRDGHVIRAQSGPGCLNICFKAYLDVHKKSGPEPDEANL